MPDGREDRALARLKADPDVRLALSNVPVQVASSHVLTWPLEVGNDADVDADAAWETTWEGQDVTVGVVDQSVDRAHPKLTARVDQDPDGRYDFVKDETDCTAPTPTGRNDHGTHVAGLIVAEPNPEGVFNLVVGLAPLARVRPYRAIDNCGYGTLASVMAAFDAAGKDDLPIVSASLATSPLLSAELKVDYDAGIASVVSRYPGTLYVVAAGNTGADIDKRGSEVYPCSTNEPNIVCVGMTGNAYPGDASMFTDSPVCWGNVGKSSVDLFAPGTRMFSTVRGANGTPSLAMLEGTSQATALAAAAAALIVSKDPMASDGAGLKEELMSATDYFPSLDPLSVTSGRLNAARGVLDNSRNLGVGGPSLPWQSCDTDHDGVFGGNDTCPSLAAPNTADGCPDADDDGINDSDDNCTSVANPDQADQDSDGVGDALRQRPRR